MCKFGKLFCFAADEKWENTPGRRQKTEHPKTPNLDFLMRKTGSVTECSRTLKNCEDLSTFESLSVIKTIKSKSYNLDSSTIFSNVV